MSTKKEFGDFQTPSHLATRVVTLVDELFGTPELVVEPTVGLGTFLKTSIQKWNNEPIYQGYEINREYVELTRNVLGSDNVQIFHRDFFQENWKSNLSRIGRDRVLVLGNPPWITNSELGKIEGKNLPKKINQQGLRGLDALTGKANFDIAEWMLVRLIKALPVDGAIAMLCKTTTARKVLRHFWKTGEEIGDSSLFMIDAKATFDVAVDACLFFITGQPNHKNIANVYPDLDSKSISQRIGFIEGNLVANIKSYQAYKSLDGGSSLYSWRSGVKHDAAKVMELNQDGDTLINGFGKTVDIESEYVYPLLKSSDLGHGRSSARKAVLITQNHPGDNTVEIAQRAPKTWAYLMRYAHILDKRKSSIYKKRPRFSIFGIGSYSFTLWKVAIAGLYKHLSFVVIPPCDERPVLVDDTCYFIPCQSYEEATLLQELLSSAATHEFLSSLLFIDTKRPITIDILRRLSFIKLARHLGRLDELLKVSSQSTVMPEKFSTQLSIPFTELN